MAHLPPGRPILYFPHRLFNVAPNPFQEPAPGILNDYPFPMPADLFTINPQPVQLNLLPQAQTTTGRNPTNTAPQIVTLQESADALVHVRICRNFWQNLVRYASNDLPNVVRVGGGPINNANMPATLNSWTVPQPHFTSIPIAHQQAMGLKILASWYLHHTNRASNIPSINSEPGVQSEVSIQMLEALNAFMKIRYRIQIHNYENTDSCYPHWGRSCPRLHGDGTVSPENAGFPDFLLLRSSTPRDHGAIGEVKTWWTYSDIDAFRGLLNNREAILNGILVPNSGAVGAKLLRQLWGQMHFFRCRIGFVTNGRQVMAFARVTQNMIVLSDVIDWEDPDVLPGLVGVTFAGMDMKKYPPNILFDNYLCPQRDIVYNAPVPQFHH